MASRKTATRKGKGRPPSLNPKDRQISLRVTPELDARADSMARTLIRLPQYASFNLTKADVLRIALEEGLNVLESRHA